MKHFYLERFCDHPEMGVFGRLFLNGKMLAYTLEQPWNNNAPFVSCVPAGKYSLISFDSRKYGKTFALFNPELNVQVQQTGNKNDRFACLFVHAANETTELKGCVAAGLGLGFADSDKDGIAHWSLTSSKIAVERVLDLCEAGDTVEIVWKLHQPYSKK